jgi:hypothetical protein
MFMSHFAVARQIPKAVIAEHFTNTWCSICASRNPGLLSNLNSFPQLIHIAYYPSSPHAGCPLTMHNPVEANARTNYYGIYGGIPQLVVGGSVVSGVFTNPAIFSSQLSFLLPITTLNAPISSGSGGRPTKTTDPSWRNKFRYVLMSCFADTGYDKMQFASSLTIVILSAY